VLIHTSAGEQIGPFSRKQVADKLAKGELTGDDHFWFDGWSGWTKLADHDELVDLSVDSGDAPAGPAPGESEDDYLDRVFGELVQASWDWHDDHAFAQHVDEVFLGAVITATLDAGYQLIDLTSDGTHHYLRFEDPTDNSRMIFRLTHLTGSRSLAKILGHRASVIVGYGQRTKNIGQVMKAVQAEYKSGFIRDDEPGTISVDGDLQSGYVYVQVDLTWTIDEYVDRDYTIHYAHLTKHIRACRHALKKYLNGRFG
jgi:hypothetical protein